MGERKPEIGRRPNPAPVHELANTLAKRVADGVFSEAEKARMLEVIETLNAALNQNETETITKLFRQFQRLWAGLPAEKKEKDKK